tara:strand:- start:160 stop:372 length:213 start_codon:yes stop_codon:yes gene_type:complete
MNGIEKVVRGFQDFKKSPTVTWSLDHIADVIGRKRNHMYNLFNEKYVISKEDKEKLNQLFKTHNYDKYIS